ncbi:hypothetical protein JB92DRAFT_2888295 [Gautieria morchelliformis]|nr:hypothetical protein JB92DRAFT_2888295 [Gautieria morchelliformis]
MSEGMYLKTSGLPAHRNDSWSRLTQIRSQNRAPMLHGNVHLHLCDVYQHSVFSHIYKPRQGHRSGVMYISRIFIYTYPTPFPPLLFLLNVSRHCEYAYPCATHHHPRLHQPPQREKLDVTSRYLPPPCPSWRCDAFVRSSRFHHPPLQGCEITQTPPRPSASVIIPALPPHNSASGFDAGAEEGSFLMRPAFDRMARTCITYPCANYRSVSACAAEAIAQCEQRGPNSLPGAMHFARSTMPCTWHRATKAAMLGSPTNKLTVEDLYNVLSARFPSCGAVKRDMIRTKLRTDSLFTMEEIPGLTRDPWWVYSKTEIKGRRRRKATKGKEPPTHHPPNAQVTLHDGLRVEDAMRHPRPNKRIFSSWPPPE